MKFTKEVLEEAAKNSNSIVGVMRYIKSSMSGGSHNHIKNKLKKFEIDISHFKHQVEFLKEAAAKKAKTERLNPEDVLKISNGERTRGCTLHKALQTIGRKYECARCKIVDYNSEPLTLQVDHIDGNWKDNRRENLQYLCPNCHGQKSKLQRKRKYSDELILEACNKYKNLKDIASSLKEKNYDFLYPRIRKIAKDNQLTFV